MMCELLTVRYGIHKLIVFMATQNYRLSNYAEMKLEEKKIKFEITIQLCSCSICLLVIGN